MRSPGFPCDDQPFLKNLSLCTPSFHPSHGATARAQQASRDSSVRVRCRNSKFVRHTQSWSNRGQPLRSQKTLRSTTKAKSVLAASHSHSQPRGAELLKTELTSDINVTGSYGIFIKKRKNACHFSCSAVSSLWSCSHSSPSQQRSVVGC